MSLPDPSGRWREAEEEEEEEEGRREEVDSRKDRKDIDAIRRFRGNTD